MFLCFVGWIENRRNCFSRLIETTGNKTTTDETPPAVDEDNTPVPGSEKPERNSYDNCTMNTCIFAAPNNVLSATLLGAERNTKFSKENVKHDFHAGNYTHFIEK
jgi:hypothetical protein